MAAADTSKSQHNLHDKSKRKNEMIRKVHVAHFSEEVISYIQTNWTLWIEFQLKGQHLYYIEKVSFRKMDKNFMTSLIILIFIERVSCQWNVYRTLFVIRLTTERKSKQYHIMYKRQFQWSYYSTNRLVLQTLDSK